MCADDGSRDDQIRNLDSIDTTSNPNANEISQRVQRTKAGAGSIQNIPGNNSLSSSVLCLFSVLENVQCFRDENRHGGLAGSRSSESPV